MLSEAPSHLEEYFLYDDEAAELHATWSRMYATLDDFEKAATKAEDAATKFFRVHDWLRGAMLVGDVITLQQEAGRQEDAIATFTKYTDHKWVHWRLFLQRPLSFMPFLASAPFPGFGSKPPDMGTVELLESNFESIQAEFEAMMLGSNRDAFNDLVKTDPRLVSKGAEDDFAAFEFRRGGRWNEKECKLFPTVCSILKIDPSVSGQIDIGRAAKLNKEQGGFLVPTGGEVDAADGPGDKAVALHNKLWYHSDYAGQRANIDTLALSKNDGFVPDQVVAIRRLSARSRYVRVRGCVGAWVRAFVCTYACVNTSAFLTQSAASALILYVIYIYIFYMFFLGVAFYCNYICSISVHAGSTNAVINIQFGLRVPPGTYLRVGTETRQWTVGEPTVWDESFEHEVKNTADVPRYVLHVQVWHPGLMPLVLERHPEEVAESSSSTSPQQQQQRHQGRSDL